MSGSVLLAFSVPLIFGTSSDEGSEALPDNRVYLTILVPWSKPLLIKPDRSEHVVQRSKADGGAAVPMKH